MVGVVTHNPFRVLHNYPLHLTSAIFKEAIMFAPLRALAREADHPAP